MIGVGPVLIQDQEFYYTLHTFAVCLPDEALYIERHSPLFGNN